MCGRSDLRVHRLQPTQHLPRLAPAAERRQRMSQERQRPPIVRVELDGAAVVVERALDVAHRLAGHADERVRAR
jgi:hypothetical protein